MSGVGCLRTTSTARRNARQHYVKRKRNLIGSVQLLTLTIGVLVVHQLSRPMDREGLQPTARIAGFGRGPVWVRTRLDPKDPIQEFPGNERELTPARLSQNA